MASLALCQSPSIAYNKIVARPVNSLLFLLLMTGAAFGQSRAFTVENRPGVVMFKRYSWGDETNLLAAEFSSYVDRRAEYEVGRGYVQFNFPQGLQRQIDATTIVEVLFFEDLKPPADIVTRSDLEVLNQKIETVQRVSARSKNAGAVLSPYLVVLQNDAEQYRAGKVKQAGVWLDRGNFLEAEIQKVRQAAERGELREMDQVQQAIGGLKRKAGNSPLPKEAETGIRNTFVGAKLAEVEEAIAAAKFALAGDLIKKLAREAGAFALPSELKRRLADLRDRVNQLTRDQRRASLIGELRSAGVSDARAESITEELGRIGLASEADRKLVEAVKQRLARSRAAADAVRGLSIQADALLGSAAIHLKRTGDLSAPGDPSLKNLSGEIDSAWNSLPESQAGARVRLADLRSMLETVGQLNFHLSNKDWKQVQVMNVRLRDVAGRIGSTTELSDEVDRVLGARRAEVTKLIQEAGKKEAAGDRSEAFLLYLKANEILPDERAKREIDRLREQALGL